MSTKRPKERQRRVWQKKGESEQYSWWISIWVIYIECFHDSHRRFVNLALVSTPPFFIKSSQNSYIWSKFKKTKHITFEKDAVFLFLEKLKRLHTLLYEMFSNSKGKNFVWRIYCFLPLNLRVLPADSDGNICKKWMQNALRFVMKNRSFSTLINNF